MASEKLEAADKVEAAEKLEAADKVEAAKKLAFPLLSVAASLWLEFQPFVLSFLCTRSRPFRRPPSYQNRPRYLEVSLPFSCRSHPVHSFVWSSHREINFALEGL
jgi:hypothetical protein